MSVAIEKTEAALTKITGKVVDAVHPVGGPLPGTRGKHKIADAVGTVLTGGAKNAGTKGYLSSYFKQLESNPLRTKMFTAGTLAGLQEIIASWLAKDRNKHGHYFTSRIPKMAVYGALVSAPLGHFMMWLLQRLFRGSVSLRSKVWQILISNTIIAPIQNSVYLVAMALIAGAKTFHHVRATVKVGFWKVMKISWLTSPICLAFAQQFLPENLWVPFFNLVAFVIGTYINTTTKKKRLAALRKKHFGDGGRGGSTVISGPPPPMRPPMGSPDEYAPHLAPHHGGSVHGHMGGGPGMGPDMGRPGMGPDMHGPGGRY